MSAVKLSIAGSSGSYAAFGRACSSYLLETDDAKVLLDCGNGSMANLTRLCDVADLDAVVVSHLHPDHFSDLYGLRCALKFRPEGPAARLDLHAPRGAESHIGRLLASSEALTGQFAVHERAAGDRFSVGPFDFEIFAGAHPVENNAMRITVGGAVIAYSGDSGPCDQIVECARDADMFVCDSSWLASEGPYPSDLHMTGEEAGRHARLAGARRLLVTHVFPTHDADDVAAEAAAQFSGEILVARDMEEHLV